ncbi:MAG: cob(I)yrinic acid a,c-diamide adenosyltransferase, partial [Halobacteria archaeon]|nr:cob(I)yrinic acid a,c-diamide adenosyltransferase [Halobacteria archaeon]
AIGHDWSVHMVQFMKGEPFPEYGEISIIRELDGFSVEQFPTKHFVSEDDVREQDKRVMQDALEASRIAVNSSYDMVILDEINVACHFGLIDASEVVELTESTDCELVLTGRYAPSEVVEKADIVTRMEKVEHPYDSGDDTDAREGVEW